MKIRLKYILLITTVKRSVTIKYLICKYEFNTFYCVLNWFDEFIKESRQNLTVCFMKENAFNYGWLNSVNS